MGCPGASDGNGAQGPYLSPDPPSPEGEGGAPLDEETCGYSVAQLPYMIGINPTMDLNRSQLLRSGRVQPASAMAEMRGKTRRSKMARSVMLSDQMQLWMPRRCLRP